MHSQHNEPQSWEDKLLKDQHITQTKNFSWTHIKSVHKHTRQYMCVCVEKKKKKRSKRLKKRKKGEGVRGREREGGGGGKPFHKVTI